MPAKFEILLIDDSSSDAKIFELALNEAGSRANLYWVKSAEEGLDYLAGKGRFAEYHPPRIVFSDIDMPRRDGFQLIAEIRKNPHLSSLPIVVFSGSRDANDIARAHRLGATSYVVKPMSFDVWVVKLKIIVRYWLDTVEPVPLGGPD